MINMPKKQQSNQLANLTTLAGAGAGAMVGGPAGMGLGMQAGGAIGGITQGNQKDGPSAVETSAIGRRMKQLDQAPLSQIRNSIDSLQYIEDPQMRVELGKPLVMAEMMAKKQGANGS